jgi:hypothetical protein
MILLAIEYPAPGVDTSDGKIQGGRKSALVDGAEPAPVEPDSDDSCVTDSGEDAENLDGHKLVQLAQAVHKGQPILILDTLQGLSEDEALWFTLRAWARFQPRVPERTQA